MRAHAPKTKAIDSGTTRRDLRSRGGARPPDDPRYTSEMGKRISVPLAHLVIMHREIGIHRGRKAGFRDVFAFHSLQDLPFIRLAAKVKDAYEGRRVPPHDGWPAQREALQWLVDKGRDAIYALNAEKPIQVQEGHYRRYYIRDGHHRLLALYILGDSEIRDAKLKRD